MVGAKELVVEFLSAFDRELSVQQLLRAAAVFDIGESSVRVALVRLREQGRVVSRRRGVYALGDASRPLHQRVVSWRESQRLTRAWNGTWLAASYAEVTGRTDLRHAQRALRLWGFRELHARLALRPHNLSMPLDEMRTRLRELGFGAGFISVMSDLDADVDARARRLWDDSGLDDAYDAMSAVLETSRRRLASVPLDEAVHESFIVGRSAIRLLVLDPLLPQPWSRRRAFCAVAGGAGNRAAPLRRIVAARGLPDQSGANPSVPARAPARSQTRSLRLPDARQP